jgi:hypothetical protein
MLLTAHESRREISGYPTLIWLPTVAPGQISGALRIASSVLHILSHTEAALNSSDTGLRDRAKGSAGMFQRGKFPEVDFYSPETHFSNSAVGSSGYRGTHGTQQAWINSRNLTTIATQTKHRQPIFLHPIALAERDRRFILWSQANFVRRELAESVSVL